MILVLAGSDGSRIVIAKRFKTDAARIVTRVLRTALDELHRR
jgi:hypothetical protein